MVDDRDSVNPDGIAIIGIDGRFPGARDIEAFWHNLRAGAESIVGLSEDEMLAAGVSPAEFADPNYVRAGASLDDVELFDAAFFGYSPREAQSIDPQQRFFLETAWTALERAGYDPADYSGAIGVFAGSTTSSYLPLLQIDPELMGLLGHDQLILGNDKDNLTTRVSYKLNLRGPSLAVQTACSTSLVAVCMACQSLLAHECDMALAGGVTIVVPQQTGYWYEEGGIIAPEGHCRAFDAAAKGTVGGNGVGVVVLKRLADALADGDHVHAVLRGFAVNNDGALKVGFTAPSVQGQAEVIGMALALAGVEPDDISYVETHGTGTPQLYVLDPTRQPTPIGVPAARQAEARGAGAAKTACRRSQARMMIGGEIYRLCAESSCTQVLQFNEYANAIIISERVQPPVSFS